MTSHNPDELDDFINERSRSNPFFPAMVDEATAIHELLRALRQVRVDRGLSQAEVASRTGLSRSVVVRIEELDSNVPVSFLGSYAAAVGTRITWALSGVEAS